jgi:hypothetical protein
MPYCYQGRCRECGYASEQCEDPTLALLVPLDSPGLRDSRNPASENRVNLLAGHGDAELRDFFLYRLTHPFEVSEMRRFERSPLQAKRCGEVVDATPVVCRDCGSLFPKFELVPPPSEAGCFPGLVVFLIAWIAAACWLENTFLELIIAFVALVFFNRVVCPVFDRGRYDRFMLDYRGRAKGLAELSRCASCNGRAYQRIESAEPVRCVACGKQAVEFECLGRS